MDRVQVETSRVVKCALCDNPARQVVQLTVAPDAMGQWAAVTTMIHTKEVTEAVRVRPDPTRWEGVWVVCDGHGLHVDGYQVEFKGRLSNV